MSAKGILETHYELEVSTDFGDLDVERLRTAFNLAKAANATANWCGLTLPTEKWRELYDDPVALGRAFDKAEPTTRPCSRASTRASSARRRWSATTSARRPSTWPTRPSRGVPQQHPDYYLAFDKFVSNLGDSMKRFLAMQRDGYMRLLEQPAELNRVSWAAFTRCAAARTTRTTTIEAPARLHAADGQAHRPELQRLTNQGTGMTSNVTAQDVFNLRPCLEQHIKTLGDMMGWCRGYDVRGARAALHVLRHPAGPSPALDRRLLEKNATRPDYDRIQLHLPSTLRDTRGHGAAAGGGPGPLSTIHSDLTPKDKSCRKMRTILYSVGKWSGSPEAANVFLNSATVAPFMWGWGHPMNLMQGIDTTTGGLGGVIPGGPGGVGAISAVVAPYLKYNTPQPPSTSTRARQPRLPQQVGGLVANGHDARQ